MASAPFDAGPVTGRVDRDGRLTAADPALLRLQQEAGSGLGAPIALPQIAAVVRSAMKLGVPLSRSVIAASSDRDLDLWVRAEPDEEGASLTIDGWKARPPAPPRLTLVGSEPAVGELPARALTLTADEELKIKRIDEELCRQLGLDAEAVVGQPLTRHLLLTDNGDGVMPLLTALVGREDFIGQVARVRGKGEDSQIMLRGSALRTPANGFAGYEIEVSLPGEVDAPAQAVLDPALDEALRSPLDRIIAAAERIVDRSEGPLRSDYAAYAGDIAAAGRHLLSVIRSMTEQEAAKPAAGHVDMVEAASEAIQLVQARAEERSIQIELVGADKGLHAAGDQRGVVQILVNLLGNAVRHSPERGTIAVIVERRAGQIAVTVADEGPGIAETDQQRIFEKYERIGDTPGGIGLGLAISRRLARSMGGDVELRSAPGEGARFTLVLPAA
jgi:signal transduction histidine kinase